MEILCHSPIVFARYIIAKDLARYGLTHAHMTDCALGFGEYKNHSKAERVKIQSLLTEHIKRRSRFGFGICLSPDAYNDAVGNITGAPSAYSFCLMMCLKKVSEFSNAIGYAGKLAYFFESGHVDANEAQRFMNYIFMAGEATSSAYRYAGHDFVDKKIGLPLQAADMFAWHLRHYYDRCLDGHNTPRKDYLALHRKFDFQALVSNTHLIALRELFLRAAPLHQDGRFQEFEAAGNEVMRSFGLAQLPTWLPKNTRVGRGVKSDKAIIRF